LSNRAGAKNERNNKAEADQIPGGKTGKHSSNPFTQAAKVRAEDGRLKLGPAKRQKTRDGKKTGTADTHCLVTHSRYPMGQGKVKKKFLSKKKTQKPLELY